MVALAVLVALEAGAATALPELRGATALWATGAIRTTELVLGLVYWVGRGWTLEDLGMAGPRARRGLLGGTLACAALGGAVAGVELASRAGLGRSFLSALAGPRPGAGELAPLILVGAGVAPLFEEFAFRGLLYGGLRRRLGPLPAGAAATTAFAAAHLLTAGVPWVQAVGGLIFFAAYEITGSLWAPVLIHGAGNLALFLLPFALR